MVNNGVLTTTLNIKVNYCSVISGALERGFYNMCTLVIKLVSFYIGNLRYLTLLKGKSNFIAILYFVQTISMKALCTLNLDQSWKLTNCQ